MKFKAIFLILSSNDNPIYDKFKKLHCIYLKNYYPIIKFFFIEFNNNITEDILEIDNYIYVKGTESINPGMIIKTCKAIEYINNRYKYEFLIRTNLSTLFNMMNLLEYISIIPTENACGGFGYRSFISGTCIVLSHDITFKIVENFYKYDILVHNEDIIISAVLNKLETPYFNCNKYYKWGIIQDIKTEEHDDYYFILSNGEYNENIIFPDNILNFRIKNTLDRSIDIKYFKLLLYKIYNISNQ
jgi:hypothetical protein